MKNKISLFILLLFAAMNANAAISVYALPVTNICTGSTVQMRCNSSGGTWSSSNTSVGTIDVNSGLLSAIAAGTVRITYTTSSDMGSVLLTVTTVDGTVALSGDLNVCGGGGTTQLYADQSGNWSTTAGGLLTSVTTGGLVTGNHSGGVPAGTWPVIYTLSNTCQSSRLVTVHANVTGYNINGGKVCRGQTIQYEGQNLYSLTATYSSSNTAIATVNSSTGIVTGEDIGTANITYTMSNSCYLVRSVNIVGPIAITGPDNVCVGATGTYTCSTAGVYGVWSSSNTAIGTIGSLTGVLNGISAGTVTISYTSSIAGAGNCFRTKTVTIGVPPIEGDLDICVGNSSTLSNSAPGGTWSSSNTSVGTIGSTSGILYGVGSGSTVITYTIPAGCYITATANVTAAFEFTVCERLPTTICGNAFTYCEGLELTAGGGGSGTIYTWTAPIPASETSEGDDLAVFTFTAAPTSGTYTVSATSGSGCTVPKVITLVDPGEGCRPCEYMKVCNSAYPGEDGQPSYHTIVGADLTEANVSAETPARYFVAGGASPVTLTLGVSPAPGSVFFMGENVTLAVSDSVVLDSVHFFSSPDCQWNGISVVNNGEHVGKLKVMRNTLIENSVLAGVLVTGAMPVSYLPVVGNILETESSIYNRNGYGVRILQYMLSSSTPSYPFEFKSSVFTSRNFCNFYKTAEPASFADCYPFSWPTAAQLASTSETGVNPAFGADAFPAVYNLANIGIFIDSCGHTDSSETGYDYYGITIGDQSNVDDYNLFDTLSRGVVTLNGNIKLYNNIFRRTAGQPGVLSAGVQGFRTGYVKRSIEVLSGSTTGTNNRFYNCRTGVYGYSWPNLVCRKAKMSIDIPVRSNDVNKMSYGIRNTVPVPYSFVDKQVFEDNNISYHKRGIDLSLNSSVNPDAMVYIENNVLLDTFAYPDTGQGGYGINVMDVTTTTARGASLSITDNSVTGFEKGIYVLGTASYASQLVSHIDDNTVVMTYQSGASPFTRIGIGVNKSAYVKTITNNHVYGDVSTDMDFNGPASTITPEGHAGFMMRSVSDTVGEFSDISCNYVHDVIVGFRFQNVNAVKWHNNVMARHTYGLALVHDDVDAEIGDQGDVCDPADNIWIDDAGSTGGWPGAWSGSVYQTVTQQSDADLSTLYTRPNSGVYIFRPTVHTTVSGVAYSGSSVLAASTSGCEGTASECSPYPAAKMVGGQSATGEVIGYALSPNPGNGIFTITRAEAAKQPVSVRIYNVTGAVVYKSQADFSDGSAGIDISAVANGLYMVVLGEDSGKTTTLKLVKQ